MSDRKVNFVLQVGSEPSSKSHPGALAPVSADAQVPGRPMYSGGGNEPHINIMTTPACTMDNTNNATRQTPASIIDLTPLAHAISSPTLSEPSPWTLVPPKNKKKRKKKKRTDNRQTDSDVPHAPLGNGGGKRIATCDPERLIAGTSRVTCDSGGSNEDRLPPNGGRPPVTSTTSRSHSAGILTMGQESARNPWTSGKSSTTTGSECASHGSGKYFGGHSDPAGNPNQAQGASDSGEPNIARPPKQTPKLTPTELSNPDPPKSNPHVDQAPPPGKRTRPRFRRRDRANHKPNNQDRGGSSGLSSKRDRLDDTISPRGENKRARVDRRPGDAAGSFAEAIQSHLRVAVTTQPRHDLTLVEANNIQGQIQEAIFAACLAPRALGQTIYAPAFDGKAFHSEGVLKMWCHDERALSWLKTLVPQLTSPKSGTVLTVIGQAEIPRRISSALFVPEYKGEIGRLHGILSGQNPWYDVSQWTLYNHKATTNDPGIFLALGIPVDQIPTILARGRKVAYSTGAIYVRFFTDAGLSEVPPGFSSEPENRGETDVDADMDQSDQPADNSCPPTPDPSVSTVLNNIEAMLTDTQNSHPQPNSQRQEDANTNILVATTPAPLPTARAQEK